LRNSALGKNWTVFKTYNYRKSEHISLYSFPLTRDVKNSFSGTWCVSKNWKKTTLDRGSRSERLRFRIHLQFQVSYSRDPHRIWIWNLHVVFSNCQPARDGKTVCNAIWSIA